MTSVKRFCSFDARTRWLLIIVGVVNYSTHGDSANAPRGWFHEYGMGTGSRSDEGVLVAAFNGMHGWFWRNRSDQVVTVILRTSGDYEAVKQIE